MPTISNIDILNAIRAEAGGDYESRVPQATRDNIALVGNAILDFKVTKNQFVDTLINKIGLTMVSGFDANNPLAIFRGADLDFGDTMEDIYVDATSGEQYDPNSENPFKQSKPTFKINYHRQDRQLKYKKTISNKQLKSAFKSADGLAKLITQVTASMYASKEWDDFTMTKELIKLNREKTATKSIVKVKPGSTPEETAKNVLKEIKRYSSNINYVTNVYNKAGAYTRTPLENQYVIMHKDTKLEIDMEYLAGIFNLEKVDAKTKLIEVDNFNADKNILAVLVDNRGIIISSTLNESDTLYNPDALYYNVFLHAWAIYSMAQFRNVIYFELDETTGE